MVAARKRHRSLVAADRTSQVSLQGGRMGWQQCKESSWPHSDSPAVAEMCTVGDSDMLESSN